MYRNKKILLIVPARGGSKGIKLKNLSKIKGLSLIARVGKIVQEISFIDKAIVSTDHSMIAKVAIENGLEVPFMRPKSISGDLISDLEVLTHALNQTEVIHGEVYDIVVMLQPTSPLRKAEHVIRCIDKLIDNNFDSVWTISKNDSKNHPLKQIIIKDKKISLYDDMGSDIIARQQLKPLYYRNGAAYAMSRNCLLKNKSLMTKNTGYVLLEEPMISIDNEWDIKLVEFIISQNQKK